MRMAEVFYDEALPGVGHWPQLESPDAFEALLLDFLAQQRATVH